MTIYSQITGNKIKTYFILFFFIAFVSMVFYLIGLYVGNSTIYFVIGLAIALISGVGSYFYSDKIVLAMNRAKPADKKEYFDYYTAVENISIAAGLPMPRLYVIDDPAPNAFATGRDPKHAVVAATTGLLSRLQRAEIEGVVAHELGHVKNYDILLMTIVTVLVGSVAYTIDFVTRSMWWGGFSNRSDDRKNGGIGFIFFIVFLFITPLIASLIQLAVSRRREYLADATGALLTRNPDALASALLKIADYPVSMKAASSATAHLYISNPFKKEGNSGKFLTGLFSTHPPVEERVRLLRAM